MHLLLESHVPRTTPLGVVVSFGIHALLAFVVIAAYRSGLEDSDKALDEFAMFLVPPNRPIYVAGNLARFQAGTNGEGKNPGEKGQRGTGSGSAGAYSAAAGDTATSTQLSISLPTML